MHEFINSNPGLRSRFDKFFEFHDYHPHEMFAIAQCIFAREEVILESSAAAHLRLSAMKKEERTPELMTRILFEDVKEFELINHTRIDDDRQIGFKR